MSLSMAYPTASSLHGLKHQTKALENQAAIMRRKRLEKLRAAKKLDTSIVHNQIKLESTVHDLNDHQVRYKQTKTKMEFLTQRLNATLSDMTLLARASGQRLQQIYMGERIGMLQVILASREVSQFLDRVYYQQRVIQQDKRLLSRLRQKGVVLNSQRKELAVQRQLIAQNIHQISTLKNVVSDQIENDQDLKERYERDAAYYEMAERKLLAESAAIRQQLITLIQQLNARRSFHIAGNTGIFSWPLFGPIRSGFGYRMHPIHHVSMMHTGLDIGGSLGTPVRATDGGQVISAGWRGGYGKVVMIYHGNRNGVSLVSLYGHLSAFAVGSGQAVGKGQVIAYVGSTGYSTGPHLHFEIRENGSPVNPIKYLR